MDGAEATSEEQRALLAMVGAFSAEQLAPRAADDDRAGIFPQEAFVELGRLDLMGLPFDEDAGGSGQPYSLYLQVVETLTRAHTAVGLGLSVHTLATWAVASYGSDELRTGVLEHMTSGRWLGAYALSEPGSGSDAAALVTKAARDGGHYVIDGVKAWVSHVGVADFYVVMCRTGEHKTRGISALLVPADTPGLSFAPPERKMGLAASPTGQLLFDGARVPAGNLLGEEGEGLRIALRSLDGGRLGIAACATGIAQAALDVAVAYATQREQFGQPIAEFQGIGFMLADMATGIAASRELYLAGARRRDDGQDYRRAAAMAKLFASDMAMRVTTDAVQVLGGAGYTREHPAERLMREAKVMQIVEGTNQIQRLVIARDLASAGGAAGRP